MMNLSNDNGPNNYFYKNNLVQNNSDPEKVKVTNNNSSNSRINPILKSQTPKIGYYLGNFKALQETSKERIQFVESQINLISEKRYHNFVQISNNLTEQQKNDPTFDPTTADLDPESRVIIMLTLSGVRICNFDLSVTYGTHSLNRICHTTCEPISKLFAYTARDVGMDHYQCYIFQTEEAEELSSLFDNAFKLGQVSLKKDQVMNNFLANKVIDIGLPSEVPVQNKDSEPDSNSKNDSCLPTSESGHSFLKENNEGLEPENFNRISSIQSVNNEKFLPVQNINNQAKFLQLQQQQQQKQHHHQELLNRNVSQISEFTNITPIPNGQLTRLQTLEDRVLAEVITENFNALNMMEENQDNSKKGCMPSAVMSQSKNQIGITEMALHHQLAANLNRRLSSDNCLDSTVNNFFRVSSSTTPTPPFQNYSDSDQNLAHDNKGDYRQNAQSVNYHRKSSLDGILDQRRFENDNLIFQQQNFTKNPNQIYQNSVKSQNSMHTFSDQMFLAPSLASSTVVTNLTDYSKKSDNEKLSNNNNPLLANLTVSSSTSNTFQQISKALNRSKSGRKKTLQGTKSSPIMSSGSSSKCGMNKLFFIGSNKYSASCKGSNEKVEIQSNNKLTKVREETVSGHSGENCDEFTFRVPKAAIKSPSVQGNLCNAPEENLLRPRSQTTAQPPNQSGLQVAECQSQMNTVNKNQSNANANQEFVYQNHLKNNLPSVQNSIKSQIYMGEVNNGCAVLQKHHLMKSSLGPSLSCNAALPYNNQGRQNQINNPIGGLLHSHNKSAQDIPNKIPLGPVNSLQNNGIEMIPPYRNFSQALKNSELDHNNQPLQSDHCMSTKIPNKIEDSRSLISKITNPINSNNTKNSRQNFTVTDSMKTNSSNNSANSSGLGSLQCSSGNGTWDGLQYFNGERTKGTKISHLEDVDDVCRLVNNKFAGDKFFGTFFGIDHILVSKIQKPIFHHLRSQQIQTKEKLQLPKIKNLLSHHKIPRPLPSTKQLDQQLHQIITKISSNYSQSKLATNRKL